jgi:hypothetical protein
VWLLYHNAETNLVYLVSIALLKADAPNAPNVCKIAAVPDWNEDGKLEVIVHSFYYEGGQTTIYRCEPDKIEPVLSVECGA